ncbi:MAG: nucleotidyltransferase domain-containing protein [Candidatus Aenigmarchaeota archaeon]|nr:nucleotidyltransferase domain-containing protein [Candidatus Aenigmarchaeota archaeon]
MMFFYIILEGMIFAKYLEKLVGNKTKIGMLRMFSRIPEKVWSSRDLAKAIGTYNTTVLDNLGDFEEMGLIDLGYHGHVKTIKVNKDSFLFAGVVKPLFEKEAKSLDFLLEDLKSTINTDGLKLAAVFGSIAEHKERPDSDIDILVVTSKKISAEKLLEDNQHRMLKKYGNQISAFVFSPEEFRKKKNAPFIKEAMKNNIVLYGKWV